MLGNIHLAHLAQNTDEDMDIESEDSDYVEAV